MNADFESWFRQSAIHFYSVRRVLDTSGGSHFWAARTPKNPDSRALLHSEDCSTHLAGLYLL
jgi:hypothetical protein